MSSTDYQQLTDNVRQNLAPLRRGQAELMQNFSALGKSATSSGALDEKTKELIATAIAVAIRCDDCIGFHVQALVRLGASEEELMETLGVNVYMGGGPSLMYASHAIDAFKQFSKA